MRRRFAAITSILLILTSGASAYATGTTTPAPAPTPEFVIAGDAEGFRIQMLDFVRQVDEALYVAMQDPRIAPVLAQHLDQRSLQSPFPDDLYRSLQLASPDQMEQLRQAVAAVPGVMSTASTLEATMLAMPPTQLTNGTTAPAGSCGTPPQEYATVVSRTAALNGLVIAKNSVGLLTVIAAIADKIADDGTGECEWNVPLCIQVPTSWLQSPFTIALTVFEVTDIALDIAINEMQFQIADANLCINPLTPHGFSDYKRLDTATTLYGRGCDNRDNDDNDGIDELDEDMSPPTVSLDEGISANCFTSAAMAEEAANAAAKAHDDCAEVDPNVVFSYNASLCQANVTATASDANPANAPAVATATLTVDPFPPVITLPTPAACYTDLAAAKAAFSPLAPGVMISDCTGVRSDLSVTEKECIADLELTAVDTCGNESSSMVSVRVDDTPPDVRIDRLLIPSVNGLACFDTEADAVATVTEATTVSDNCTPRQDMVFGTTTSGPACNLEVTTTASDQCVGVTTGASSDSLTVRVDHQAPSVTCSVGTELLWPADDRLVDVGVNIAVSDNCDGTATPYDVFVTSDEPTMYNLRVMGDEDLAPDAFIERDQNGGVQRILLRAQRRQDSSDDGRVYRIRVIATDSCGLASQADCYVTVPKNYKPPTDAGMIVNSGQLFDATEVN